MNSVVLRSICHILFCIISKNTPWDSYIVTTKFSLFREKFVAKAVFHTRSENILFCLRDYD